MSSACLRQPPSARCFCLLQHSRFSFPKRVLSHLNMLIIVLFLFSIFIHTSTKEIAPPIAETSAGQVEGIWFDNLAAFQGIPYSQPPIGQYRFQKPIPITKWNGRLQAKTFAKSCHQIGSPYVTDEDCLYLNVFAPKDEKTELLPVLVWLSSNFDSGSASDFPAASLKNLIDQGVVVVTVNYRLNFFGFYFTNRSSKFPPNLAMWDQVLALQWVQREIRNFGGDPEKVTLSGHGHGSAMASLHTYSTMSSGLFSKIILHSGTAMNPFAISGNRYHIESNKWMEIALGCVSDNSTMENSTLTDLSDVSSCMLNKSWSDIQQAMMLSDNGTKSSRLGLEHDSVFQSPWSPVVDRSEEFLSEHPFSSTADRQLNIPVLMGSVKNEKAILSASVTGESDYDWILGLLARQEAFPGKFKMVQNLLKFFYADQYDVDKDIDFWKKVTVQTASDYWIHVGVADEAANLYEAGADVFLYSFDYDCETLPGHGKELAYLFPGNRRTSEMRLSKNDKLISTRMVEMWANFIKSGNPNPSGSTLWKSLSDDVDGFLSIDTNTSMKKGFHDKAVLLWKDVIEPLVALPYADFKNSDNSSDPESNEEDNATPKQMDLVYAMLFWASLGVMVVKCVIFGLTIKRYQRKIYSYNKLRRQQRTNSS